MTEDPGQKDDQLARLHDIVARLRGENGCPWDREQTVESLKPCLVEETYEVIDAIDSGVSEHHEEELGDLLLQIVLQSRIREEQGEFSLNDVAHKICEKLVRRHPHVFGDVDVSDSRQVLKNWEQIKKKERGDKAASLFSGIPRQLPALYKAQRIQSRAARVGFDWDNENDVMAKVLEELDETRVASAADDKDSLREELGDLLFSVVNFSRFKGIKAEEALEAANRKFVKRFNKMEQRIHAEGKDMKDCSLAEMDAHWNAVKESE